MRDFQAGSPLTPVEAPMVEFARPCLGGYPGAAAELREGREHCQRQLVGRIAAVVALARRGRRRAAALLGGGDAYTVTAEFQNASQLVTGNR